MRINPAVGKKNKIYSPSQGRNANRSTGHQEVDLVPIMNLFVTLIPMLLSMVVLVSIAYISLDLTNPNASGGAASSEDKKKDKDQARIKKLELTINVDEEGEIFSFSKNDTIDVKYAQILSSDFSKLSEALKSYRTIMLEDKYGDSNISEGDNRSLPIIIIPKDYVKFGVFVKTMDLCKKMKFSDIMIGEVE